MMGMPLPSESLAAQSEAEEARLRALQLAHERKAIDGEIQSAIQVLQEQGATMTSPLVDSQGFPVATTDIVAVRTARSRINALRNDREAIEARMRMAVEAALARKEAGSSAADSSTAGQGGDAPGALPEMGRAWARVDGRDGGLSMAVDTLVGDTDDWAQVGGMQAFAKVNAVADASPAQQANLLVEDELLSFAQLDGTTAHRNSVTKDLANLPNVVEEGKEVVLVVLRRDPDGRKTVKQLRLTPASGWGGRGLLGCHIVPL